MSKQSTGIVLVIGAIVLWLSSRFNPAIVVTASHPRPQTTAVDYVRIAAIGDFGQSGRGAASVATQVAGWDPDLIVTTGDNNYPSGANSTADQNMGQYYHRYIYPYIGTSPSPTPATTPGATQNRFWPTLGNHDWNSLTVHDSKVSGPHLDYFTLNGNERYYDLRHGPIHFFMIDSDKREPDGITAESIQGQWLQQKLAESTAPWKLVLMHHPPYSSGIVHGSTPALQWPYKSWGATAVIAGHDHSYERIIVEGFPYFVNGLGGAVRYSFGLPVTGSEVRYNDTHGAMLIEATTLTLTLHMVATTGSDIDLFTLSAPTPTDTPKPLETITPISYTTKTFLPSVIR